MLCLIIYNIIYCLIYNIIVKHYRKLNIYLMVNYQRIECFKIHMKVFCDNFEDVVLPLPLDDYFKKINYLNPVNTP